MIASHAGLFELCEKLGEMRVVLSDRPR